MFMIMEIAPVTGSQITHIMCDLNISRHSMTFQAIKSNVKQKNVFEYDLVLSVVFFQFDFSKG